MLFNSLVGLLPFLASAQAFFILSHQVLQTTRLDPIVTPGIVSGHVHSIVGGSNFDKAMTYESARSSQCTTASVSEDKSNYWTPQLYYYNPKDASYQLIPVDVVNTYYLPRSGKDGKVRAFPDGLRMVSGSPMRRTFVGDADSKAVSYVCLDYAGGHSGDPEWAQRNNFFNHNCPNGMRAQVFFRSCWDGVNLDSPDHVSHMAWPSGGVDGGECPASHPIRLVSLFYEFIYRVQDFPYNEGSDPTWVFSYGDSTGYGMHGDFVNGWPAYNNGSGLLQQAIDQCSGDNAVAGVLSNCKPFQPVLDASSASRCKPQNLYVNEDIGLGHTIPQLPGNNPLWIGTGSKPSIANYTEATNYTDFKSVIPTGYTKTGCIAEAPNGRALNALYWNDAKMTVGACVAYCQTNGFPLAGVQYGVECRCDSAIRNGGSNTTILDNSRCSMNCGGNMYEQCGGPSVMTLYNNPSMYTTKALPAGWTNSGCYTEGSNGRALTGYSFSSDSMTQELCMNTCGARGFKYAGAEWSRECYCGNTLNVGSVKADDSQCSNTCAGDQKATCGGSSRLSIFTFANVTTASSSAAVSSSPSAVSSSSSIASSSVSSAAVSSSSSAVNSSAASIIPPSAVVSSSVAASSAASSSSTLIIAPSSVAPVSSSSSAAPSSASSAVASSSSSSSVAASTASSVSSAAPSPSASAALPSGWTANGCMTEATTGRALTGYSLTSADMTQDLCLSTCAARGYKYAGVEYSKECYCGDGFMTGSVPAAESNCQMKCSGDATQMCGGSRRLLTFVTNSVPADLQLPDNWSSSGCYAEPSNGRALSGYSFSSSSMTAALCISTCSSKGFNIAGTQYGSQCFCGSSLETASPLDSFRCSMPCTGDSTQRCGAGMTLSTYTKGGAAAAQVAAPVSSAAASSASSAAASKSSVAASSSSAAVSSSSAAASSASSAAASKSSVAASSSSAAASSASSIAASKSSVAASSSSAASSTVSAIPAPTSTSYIGCFVNATTTTTNVQTPVLNGTVAAFADATKMTNEVCQTYCAKAGYALAGTFDGKNCQCGNTVDLSQFTKTGCDTKCPGGEAWCGGKLTVSIWATNNGTAVTYGTKPASRKRTFSSRRSSRVI